MGRIGRILLAALAATGLGITALPVYAQDTYPSKPIEIIVDQSAGGPIDQLARAIAPFLGKHLGNGASFVVVNRTGASGIIGRTAAAKAKPDGYSTHLFTYPALITALYGQENKPYAMKDFEFLGTMTAEPSGIFVKEDSPFKSLEDLAEAAKADPGGVTISGAGLGGAGHLAVLLFQKVSGLKFNYIPNPGAAEAVTQVLGGHVDAGVTTVSGALPVVNSGQARFIGIASQERKDAIPDTETFIEAGYDMTWAPYRGLAAPAGLPDDIRDKLTAALEAAMQDPEFQELAKKSGFELTYLSGKEFTDIATKQVEMLDELWAEAPWQ